MTNGGKQPIALGDKTQIRLKTEGYRLEISHHGRGMLFNQRTGEIFSLNRAGAFIASLLQAPCQIQNLEHQFASRFGLDPESAKVDVREFLNNLYCMGLLDEERLP